MEFRKMVTMYARQQKRHRGIEQSFGLCGRGRGWDDWGEWHWNMYNIIYETNSQSRFDAGYRMLGAGALGWPREMVWGASPPWDHPYFRCQLPFMGPQATFWGWGWGFRVGNSWRKFLFLHSLNKWIVPSPILVLGKEKRTHLCSYEASILMRKTNNKK